MNEIEHSSPSRQAVTNVLAVAGFVALVALGIWLAVAATRFVPSVVGKIGAAAVSLGSVFNPAPKDPSSLVVTPGPVATSTDSTTIPFGPAATTTTATTTTVVTPAPTPVKPKPPFTPGVPTSGVYPIGGATSTPVTPSGLPDLTATITAVGYMQTSSTDSFIATTTVTSSMRLAIKFTIRNVGTGIAAPWRFTAVIPTSSSYIFESPLQQALNPGDSIDYTLGFDQATRGTNQSVSVTVNPGRTIAESNTTNNASTASITVIGS